MTSLPLLAACGGLDSKGRVDARRVSLRAQRVTETIERKVTELVHIETDHEELVTTPEHPFAKLGSGWTNAGRLAPGDQVVSTKFGTARVLRVSRENLRAPVAVFNLTVQPSHSYVVGTDQLLVHNVSCSDRSSTPSDSDAPGPSRHRRDTEERADRDPTKLDEKMQENPELWDSLPGGRETAASALASREARKLNRISGRLKRDDMAESPRGKAIAETIDALILDRPHEPLSSLFKHDGKPSEQDFYLNSQLVTALRLSGKEPEKLGKLEKELQEQWLQRNTDANPSIVAHRGDGATFEKAAVPFPRDTFDHRYRHENENSKEAVLKALTGWRDGKLDGVETDIGFTMDHVPMAEHTRETERLDRQEKYRREHPEEGGKALDELHSHELSDRHLSLEKWLETIEQFVRDNKDKIPPNGRLRLEIEMKDPELWFQRDRKLTKASDDEVLKNWRDVEKEVSQFLKRTDRPGLYQIAFFNGSVAPASARMRLREDHKTLAGYDIVYGSAGEKALTPEAAHLPEARVGGHESGVIRHLKQGDYAGRILTIAPGLEATPELKPGGRVEQVKTLGKKLDNFPSLTFEQAIQSARLRSLFNTFDGLPPEKRPARIEVLTDFGSVGADYILEHKATPIGPISESFNAKTLNCIWDKYGIKDPKLKQEAVDRLSAANGNQEKMVQFGQWFLNKIGDN